MILMTWKDVDPAKVHRLFYPQVPVIVTVERTARIGRCLQSGACRCPSILLSLESQLHLNMKPAR